MKLIGLGAAHPLLIFTFAFLTLFGLGAVASVALAGEEVPAAGSEAQPAKSSSGVGLDKLLKLPEPGSYGVESYAGNGREEWEARFAVADADTAKAKEKLSESQAKLDELSETSGGWQMAPPGMQAGENGTLSYQLMQEIRQNKEEVTQAERTRRELVVEASLAGVPDSWYREKGSTDKE